MASTTIYGDTSDGYLNEAYASHYSEARDAASATGKYDSGDDLHVGWDKTAKSLYRSYLYFDTSSLPDNAVITAATLSVYLSYADSVPLGHEIILQLGDPTTYPHDPLVKGDFDRTQYKSGGAGNIEVFSGQSGWKSWILNSTGYGWISLTGDTNFCLRSEFDISPSLPGSGMYCKFYSANKGPGYKPKLDITYSLKAEVTTDAASGVGSSDATGNGTIDSGSGITEYGFIWNDDGSDPVDLSSADNKQTSSNLAGGSFSATLSSLDPDTTFNYRAYATNGAGTGYGSTASFTTDTAPDVLSIETHAASPIGDTDVTLNGEITANPSGAINQHGFVWQQGQDPGTGAYTGASGYVELGSGATGSFSTGVAGLSSGSGYLYRSYLTTGSGNLYGNARVFRMGRPASTTVTGATGDGSLYTYGVWDDQYGCGVMDTHCTDKSTAEAESSSCGEEIGGPWSYPERAVKLTNESEIELRADCDVAGGYCYECHLTRAYLYFDTSDIPDTVTSATLYLYVTYSLWGGMYSSDGEGLDIGYSTSYPSESGGDPALDAGDFDLTHYSWIASISSATMESNGAPGAVNAYISVSIGSQYIDAGGLTKFAVVMDHEADNSYGGPTVKFQTADGANAPYLDIDYDATVTGPSLPAVNVSDSWQTGSEALINVGDTWHLVDEMKMNTGSGWASLTGS